MPDYMGAARVKIAQRQQAMGEMDRIIQQYKLDKENEERISRGALASLGAEMEHNPKGVEELAKKSPNFGKALNLLSEGKAKLKDLQLISSTLAASTQARSQDLKRKLTQSEIALRESQKAAAEQTLTESISKALALKAEKVKKTELNKALLDKVKKWNEGVQLATEAGIDPRTIIPTPEFKGAAALAPYAPVLEQGAFETKMLPDVLEAYHRKQELDLKRVAEERLLGEAQHGREIDLREQARRDLAEGRAAQKEQRDVALHGLNLRELRQDIDNREKLAPLERRKLAADIAKVEQELFNQAQIRNPVDFGEDFENWEPIDIDMAAGRELTQVAADLGNLVTSFFGTEIGPERAKAIQQVNLLNQDLRELFSKSFGTHGGQYTQELLEKILPSTFDSNAGMERKFTGLVDHLKKRYADAHDTMRMPNITDTYKSNAAKAIQKIPGLVNLLEKSVGMPLTDFEKATPPQVGPPGLQAERQVRQVNAEATREGSASMDRILRGEFRRGRGEE